MKGQESKVRENKIERLETVDEHRAPICAVHGPYDFRLFKYFTSRKAAMRQIRTTGQCLMDHFQNGLSSVDNRRTNSLRRSITSPTGKVSVGDQATV